MIAWTQHAHAEPRGVRDTGGVMVFNVLHFIEAVAQAADWLVASACLR
jgi:hypothetical protein